MKAVIWAAVIGVGLPAFSVGEEVADAGEPMTRLEAFMAQDSVVVVRGSSRVGEVVGQRGSRIVITVNELMNADTDEREHGITVDVREADSRRADHRSYVDFEELPGLLRALEYLAKLDRSATSLERLEADYRTKGGLVITMHTTRSDTRLAVSADIGGEVPLESADLERLRLLVQSAHESLAAIRAGGR